RGQRLLERRAAQVADVFDAPLRRVAAEGARALAGAEVLVLQARAPEAGFIVGDAGRVRLRRVAGHHPLAGLGVLRLAEALGRVPSAGEQQQREPFHVARYASSRRPRATAATISTSWPTPSVRAAMPGCRMSALFTS